MLYLIPGDPVDIMVLETAGGMSFEEREALRHRYGLDQPFLVQYGRYLWKAVHGDLGQSFFYKRPAVEILLEQLPATASLALSGMAIGIAVGLPLGILAAVTRNSWLDHLSMLLALVGVSIPEFWLGLVLIIVFAVHLGLLPAFGTSGVAALVLPGAALGFRSSAMIARITRISMLDVLRSEYIVTARAKGLRETVVIVRHALRNALIPIVTVMGLQLGELFGGAVIIEIVFARKGIGSLAVDSIFDKDYLMVQAIVIFVAAVYAAVNLIVDVVYAVVDPRIRYASFG
jgi:peptide/nickel transport system permease protein